VERDVKTIVQLGRRKQLIIGREVERERPAEDTTDSETNGASFSATILVNVKVIEKDWIKN
jgi:hypothetical protein